MFIEMTTSQGVPTYVNLDRVLQVCEYINGTVLVFDDGKSRTYSDDYKDTIRRLHPMKMLIDDKHMKIEGTGIELVAGLTVAAKNIASELDIKPSILIQMIGELLKAHHGDTDEDDRPH